ncbi:hypothetical protein F0000_15490 [Aquimarina sp. RZ0]|nr:hypothetical protein F0000_15490 [Aquimarina sp. RZ0]
MRYLLISVFLILFSSCKLATVKNYTRNDVSNATIHNPYFSNKKIDYVYKADINVYGKFLSGILILKKIADNKHRIVFTSQFGNTFFDIEIENNRHTVNTIVPELNRKIILNTLLKDFSLLIRENSEVIEKYSNVSYEVLKSPFNEFSNYYFYKMPEFILHRVVHATKRKEKLNIRFEEITKDQIAKKIFIDHYTIKLNIELNLLKN